MDRRERLDDIGLNEAMLASFAGFQARLWTALPGIIRKVNLLKMTVEIEPSIQARIRSPEGRFDWVTLPMLVDVPILFPSGGGYTLTFPVKPDDEALVIFSSRCIDAWWQSGGVQAQAELRMHDLSDGFALIGPRSIPRLLDPQPLTTGVELRNDSGHALVRIADTGDVSVITDANATVDAQGDVHVTAGTDLIASVGADATISATGAITLTAPTVNIVGNLVVTGTVVGAGKSLSTHTHGGVIPGSGHTGVPD